MYQKRNSNAKRNIVDHPNAKYVCLHLDTNMLVSKMQIMFRCLEVEEPSPSPAQICKKSVIWDCIDLLCC